MILRFAEYELDMDRFELRLRSSPVPLEPQVFDVLALLVSSRDRVVSKEELLDRVWGTRYVTEAALTTRIKQARRALGDDGKTQRMIRTVHGRGYRFVALVDAPMPPDQPIQAAAARGILPTGADDRLAVGRHDELAALERAFSTAASGRRQMVFVTGEPGLGKTTLVAGFLRRAATGGPVRIGLGQCVEHRGPGEAFMPLLDALARLARADPSLVALLWSHAPTWLAEMPWLLDDQRTAALRERVIGGTRERRLREIAELLDAVAAEVPTILVLEDLHWSDRSTIEVLSAIARRPDAARLLVIGTARTPEVIAPNHPLGAAAAELRSHGLLGEIRLPPLDVASLHQYLARRLEDDDIPPALVGLVAQRSGGNPMYATSLVDDWLAQGALVKEPGRWALRSVEGANRPAPPENVRGLIQRLVSRLRLRDQEILEAASVAGSEWLVAAVAAAIDGDDEEIEARCVELARSGLFLRREEPGSPDRARSPEFSFQHTLHREVFYERIPPRRRARLHLGIAGRLETVYGETVDDHASEVADHYRRADAPDKAQPFLVRAAAQALRRDAHPEAVDLLSAALECLASIPAGPTRDASEADVQAMLAPALIATKGWGAPEVEAALLRAHELTAASDGPRSSSVLYALATMYEYRGEYERSEALTEERLRREKEEVASDRPEGAALVESRELLACSNFHQGRFAEALAHADEGLANYRPERHLELMVAVGENPAVSCDNWAALALWFLGFPDRALARIGRALARAKESSHAFSLAHAYEQAATLHQLRREPDLVRERAEATIEIGERQGFPSRRATGTVLLGWARSTLDDGMDAIEQIREGLSAYRATGARMDLPYYLGLLADAELRFDRPAQSLATVDEALETITARGYCYEPELYRLRGLAAALLGRDDDALVSLRRAVEVAGRQGGRMLLLRSLTSLVQQTIGEEQAGALDSLKDVMDELDEAIGSPDVGEAAAVLNARGDHTGGPAGRIL